MKYRKILLAYNGSVEGKRALFEAADLAGFLNAETHLLAVASMPPSLFLTEGFVPEELLEEEKKRTRTVLDEGIKTYGQGLQGRGPSRSRRAGGGNLPLRQGTGRGPDRAGPQPEHVLGRPLVEGLGGGLAARLRAVQHIDCPIQGVEIS